MRLLIPVAAVAILAIGGCSAGAPEPESDSSSSSTSSSAPTGTTTSSATSSSTTTSEASPTPEPAPAREEAAPAPAEVAPAPAAPDVVAPTFVRCYLADGTALMSDGTHQYMDTCNESAGGPYLLEDGTSIYDNHPQLPAPSPDPSDLHSGWHCDGPAYLCRDDNASGKTAGQ